MIGHEKHCEGKLSTSLLEGSGSDAAQTSLLTVYYSRLRQQCRKEMKTSRLAGSWLSRMPLIRKLVLQVRHQASLVIS